MCGAPVQQTAWEAAPIQQPDVKEHLDTLALASITASKPLMGQ